MRDYITIKGARENNLKSIDLEFKKNQLVVMTGLSGSGKTSLAFDTIYEEGRRRYVESLSAYARQFLGNMKKPDVDVIEGLSPSISIDQKSTSHNPRSTVGTVTEIYDYIRLLYARVGKPYCPTHHIEIKAQSIQEMTDKVLENDQAKLIILAPIIRSKKGSHSDVIQHLRQEGYTRLRINSEDYELDQDIQLDKNKRYDIDVVIDRVIIKESARSRLYDSLETAARLGEGNVKVIIDGEERLFSENFSCPICGFTIPDLEPRLFSFNAPNGACPTCNGLGFSRKIDPKALIVDSTLSLEGNVFQKFAKTDSIYYREIEQTAIALKIPLDKAFQDLTKKQQDYLLYGTEKDINFKYVSREGKMFHQSKKPYEGVINNLERRYMSTKSKMIRRWIEGMMSDIECETCHGKRLNPEALSVYIDGKNIDDVSRLSVIDLLNFFNQLKLDKQSEEIAQPICKEVKDRLSFLVNVGLDYLTLARASMTLSGGEAQRIRLATQIGSRLTGVLYVLDEPSIGLHQRDNQRLIHSLKEMKNLGNTMIVVEHDTEMILESDLVVDIGPGAGDHGGRLEFIGTPQELIDHGQSYTGKYLRGELKIEVPKERRKHEHGYLSVIGAKQNNLKNLNVDFPIGCLTVVTGVSGSGKSSLVNEVLFKNLANLITRRRENAGLLDKLENYEQFDRIIDIDQSPIGKTPRSNPATYTGVFDHIRDLYASTKESKLRGYDKGRFSFNVKGGRCETCQGDGVIKIEMHFMPDVYVECEECHGKRYNKETLQVKYKGKNIADVLDLRVEEALDFFDKIPKIQRKLETINNVGLGYIKLGQSSTTLSGGEAQRVKLASELYKRITNQSIYILDEPTTGLHTHDIKKLMEVLNDIVDKGATVIIIEHNLDVIKTADYIIDLGPEGGERGGQVLACGSPEDIAEVKDSYTGQYLKGVLKV
ncbi:excinuclease ABC subunit UvrA [Hujiaoplasma nucleasis]|uniref:UvrABC system protein A n=1 Tax=Hujiaoplasma nucleasis TaxID=2725268 RepID=A0A7L6N2V9_9MOLU|nr:excinuclease ABC subunit UvrA [Hujiaoplasma nucleasis]QLY40503.1 excinuclease ABC subunit UvrA [Hujiaoplasma nucleasis]